jgi:hypothetical protein
MKRLITINSYRGRILLALPCRGQRNTSTVKRQLGKLRSRLKPIRKLGLTCALPIAFRLLFPFKSIQEGIQSKRQKGRSLIGKMSLPKPRYRIVPGRPCINCIFLNLGTKARTIVYIGLPI